MAESDPAGRAPPNAVAVAVLVLAGLAVLAVGAVQPPAPRPADAPAREFSAERAAAHDERIAARPHVAGSAANDEVREYLVTTLRQLGLQTEVQDAVGTDPTGDEPVGMARVRNVVALLPGTEPTGRIFLVAHYDSIQVGRGAVTTALACRRSSRPPGR